MERAKLLTESECVDSVAGTTNIYYYNDKWQVLCDYNDSNDLQMWFTYGNYIDEVLTANEGFAGSGYRYYVHDHLYSSVALVYYNGSVLERYEYDAYGNCYILEPNFAPDPDGKSDYGNPYLFTGRRVDILDNGSLKLQYNRNRYYDQYTGRWLTHDPLGITPFSGPFAPHGQYVETLNLYEYVAANPIMRKDPLGTNFGESYQQDCLERCLGQKPVFTSIQYFACETCCKAMKADVGTDAIKREIWTLACLTGFKFDDYEELIKTGKKIWEERERRRKERERKSRECPTPPRCEMPPDRALKCLLCLGCEAAVLTACSVDCVGRLPCSRPGSERDCTIDDIGDIFTPCVRDCFRRGHAIFCKGICDVCLGRSGGTRGGGSDTFTFGKAVP